MEVNRNVKFQDFSNIKPICRLYKYYSNYEYAIDVITNHRIHFEKPISYNDIYDCSFAITYLMAAYHAFTKEKTDAILKQCFPKRFHKTIDNCQLEFDKSDLYVKTMIDFICENDKSASVEKLKDYLNSPVYISSPSNYRVTCFSERRDSLLMWSYYANNHKGVCLGFDIARDDDLKKHCHKVLYSDYFLPADFNINSVFYKSTQWSHEQEWRIVLQTELSIFEKEKVEYVNTDSLSEVIFGARIPENERTSIIDHLQNQNKSISMFQAVPSTEKFELNFYALRAK